MSDKQDKTLQEWIDENLFDREGGGEKCKVGRDEVAPTEEDGEPDLRTEFLGIWSRIAELDAFCSPGEWPAQQEILETCLASWTRLVDQYPDGLVCVPDVDELLWLQLFTSRTRAPITSNDYSELALLCMDPEKIKLSHTLRVTASHGFVLERAAAELGDRRSKKHLLANVGRRATPEVRKVLHRHLSMDYMPAAPEGRSSTGPNDNQLPKGEEKQGTTAHLESVMEWSEGCLGALDELNEPSAEDLREQLSKAWEEVSMLDPFCAPGDWPSQNERVESGIRSCRAVIEQNTKSMDQLSVGEAQWLMEFHSHTEQPIGGYRYRLLVMLFVEAEKTNAARSVGLNPKGSEVLVRAGAELGDSVCRRNILRNLERRTDSRTADAIRSHLPGDTKAPRPQRRSIRRERAEQAIEQANEQVVFTGVQEPQNDEQMQNLARYRSLAGKPLPLTGNIDGRLIETTLRREAPWLEPAIKTISRALDACLIGWGNLTLPPILLVGPAGTGKSWIAERVAELLGLEKLVIEAAGKTDNRALEGTSRGWGSGRPSQLVEFIANEKVANPLVIVDEIDKVSSSDRNGNLLDSLLQLVEPQNARRWTDEYLMAPCDLSHVSWIATANKIDHLPQPLRDRFLKVEVPSPGKEDRVPMLHSVMASLERELNTGYPIHHQLSLWEWDLLCQKAESPRQARKMVKRLLSIHIREAMQRPH